MKTNEIQKVEKLRSLLVDAKKRNEVLSEELFSDLLSAMATNGLTNEMFDIIVLKKIHSIASNATSLLKKKEQSLAEKQIYCISLLSTYFFNRLIDVSIEGKKVKIIDNRF